MTTARSNPEEREYTNYFVCFLDIRATKEVNVYNFICVYSTLYAYPVSSNQPSENLKLTAISTPFEYASVMCSQKSVTPRSAWTQPKLGPAGPNFGCVRKCSKVPGHSKYRHSTKSPSSPQLSTLSCGPSAPTINARE